MFAMQLCGFLLAHHHHVWAIRMWTSEHTFEHALRWALRHGFVYHR